MDFSFYAQSKDKQRRSALFQLGQLGHTALVPPALDYAAFDLLKRFRLPIPEDRREARRQAIDLFARVAERKLAVEPDGEGEEAGASPSTAPATGRANPEKRLLD